MQLLDDLKERCWKLKEEALDRTVILEKTVDLTLRAVCVT
jgi:hypothetical protein